MRAGFEKGRDLSTAAKGEQGGDAPQWVGAPIDISGLVVSLGGQVVLHGIDLPVRAGEFLTLLGPSGSGKTTLLMAIAGFALPDAGDIRIGAIDVTMLPPHRRDIGCFSPTHCSRT